MKKSAVSLLFVLILMSFSSKAFPQGPLTVGPEEPPGSQGVGVPNCMSNGFCTEVLTVYPTPPSSVIDLGPNNPQGGPIAFWNGTGPQNVIHYCRVTFGNRSFIVQNDPIMSCVPFADSRLANFADWGPGIHYQTYVSIITPSWPTY